MVSAYCLLPTRLDVRKDARLWLVFVFFARALRAGCAFLGVKCYSAFRLRCAALFGRTEGLFFFVRNCTQRASTAVVVLLLHSRVWLGDFLEVVCFHAPKILAVQAIRSGANLAKRMVSEEPLCVLRQM